jgi:hypothetical protein
MVEASAPNCGSREHLSLSGETPPALDFAQPVIK